MNKTPSFIDELESIAQQQAELNKQRLLPSQLDWLGSWVGNYPWQIILLTSFLTALFLKLVRYE